MIGLRRPPLLPLMHMGGSGPTDEGKRDRGESVAMQIMQGNVLRIGQSGLHSRCGMAVTAKESSSRLGGRGSDPLGSCRTREWMAGAEGLRTWMRCEGGKCWSV